MITLVKYTSLTVRKRMSAQNYQSQKDKTCILKNISLAGMKAHKNKYEYLLMLNFLSRKFALKSMFLRYFDLLNLILIISITVYAYLMS